MGSRDTDKNHSNNKWIDLGTTPMPSGRYVLRSVADLRTNGIYESKGKSDGARESPKANAAVTYFTVEEDIITRRPARWRVRAYT